MHSFHFNSKQFIATNLTDAWIFFSSPANLKLITPKEMNFRITSAVSDTGIFAGQRIEYEVTPLWYMRLKWVTEITEVREKEFFVDTQVKGPYKLWQHSHYFREVPGGIEMEDKVIYRIGFGWAGQLLHHLVIRKKIEEIFLFRKKKIEEIFSTR